MYAQRWCAIKFLAGERVKTGYEEQKMSRATATKRGATSISLINTFIFYLLMYYHPSKCDVKNKLHASYIIMHHHIEITQELGWTSMQIKKIVLPSILFHGWFLNQKVQFSYPKRPIAHSYSCGGGVWSCSLYDAVTKMLRISYTHSTKIKYRTVVNGSTEEFRAKN